VKRLNCCWLFTVVCRLLTSGDWLWSLVVGRWSCLHLLLSREPKIAEQRQEPKGGPRWNLNNLRQFQNARETKYDAGYESFISLPMMLSYDLLQPTEPRKRAKRTDGRTQTVRVHVRACGCVSPSHQQDKSHKSAAVLGT